MKFIFCVYVTQFESAIVFTSSPLASSMSPVNILSTFVSPAMGLITQNSPIQLRWTCFKTGHEYFVTGIHYAEDYIHCHVDAGIQYEQLYLTLISLLPVRMSFRYFIIFYSSNLKLFSLQTFHGFTVSFFVFLPFSKATANSFWSHKNCLPKSPRT